MDISRFCQSWAFSTNRPRFSDYPTLLDDSVRLPPLQASLEDIGEYQRRLWAKLLGRTAERPKYREAEGPKS